MTLRSMLRGHRRVALLGLVSLWLVFFWTDLTKDALVFRGQGIPLPWFGLISDAVVWWGTWLLLTPPAAAVAERFHPDRRGWVRGGPWLILGAIAIGLLHLMIASSVFQLVEHLRFAGGELLTEKTFRLFAGFGILDIMTATGAVGFYLALTYYLRNREREDRTRSLELRALRLEAQMAEAQLRALRMKLNPHFLFNALNAATGLIRTGRDQDAVAMLARVGDLLRATLELDGMQEVSLARELDLLEKYLDVERARFGSRLSVRWNVDDGVLDARVPTLLLQPLVENALHHGGGGGGAASIEIAAFRDADALCLGVRDRGPGLPEDTIREGVGLSATRTRLETLYGERGQVALRNCPGGGARVDVRLPWAPEGGSVRTSAEDPVAEPDPELECLPTAGARS